MTSIRKVVILIALILLTACSRAATATPEATLADATVQIQRSTDITNAPIPTAGSSPQPESSQTIGLDPKCLGRDAVFQLYGDSVDVHCDNRYMYVETETGQPQHEMMNGITAWILRVPIPFEYLGDKAWTLPLNPVWLSEHAATHSRGPIAMAVNGVPIYHFDKRPDVLLDDTYVYDSKFDTVVQGELDHCGGHAGQGEDYHYHIAPVCLLDHHDLTLPIAFSLGGVPIYYGTGADDYYGGGRFNDINTLPSQPLDECNALRLDDGSYVYYTTNKPPYVIGCHVEAVDWSLQIEPREMRPLGEFGRNAARIVSLIQEGEVRTLLFETREGALNAIVYQPSASGENCWDFEFRTDPTQAVAPQTYCRDQ
jgi:hypothetical protein